MLFLFFPDQYSLCLKYVSLITFKIFINTISIKIQFINTFLALRNDNVQKHIIITIIHVLWHISRYKYNLIILNLHVVEVTI